MKRFLRLLALTTLAAVGSLSTAVDASAQATQAYSHPDTASPDLGTVYGALAIGGLDGGTTDLTTTTFFVGGRFVVAGPFALSLDLAFTNASISAGIVSDSTLVFANPFFAGHLLFDFEVGVFDLGFGLGIPLANIDQDDPAGFQDFFAYVSTSVVMGFWDAWLWAPEVLPMVMPMRLSLDFGAAQLAVDGAFGALVPIEGEGRDVQMLFQLGAQAGPTFGPVNFGLRLQGAALFTEDDGNDDNAQFGLGPYVRADFGPGFVSGYFHMNLDEPGGFAFDDGGAFHFAVTGGGHF